MRCNSDENGDYVKLYKYTMENYILKETYRRLSRIHFKTW